jgi:hypothetical protein
VSHPPKPRKPDPLEALHADPAVQNADPAARALLLALLTRGERAEGTAQSVTTRNNAGRMLAGK